MTEQVFVLDPTGSDPDSEYQALRARGPATRVDVVGVQAWSVSDPGLLKQLLTDKKISKDGRAHWPDFERVVQTWPLVLWVAVQNMFTAYGADHSRLRRMVAPAFTARRVAAFRPTVDALVEKVLDDLESRVDDDGLVDVREHLAYPLPIAVIGELMGFPEDRRDSFRSSVDRVFSTTMTTEESVQATADLYGALDALIEAKRADPGDDLTSLLIAARDEEGDGAGFAPEEMRDTLALMISAGYETTVNVIDQAIATLLSAPKQLAHVREGRATWADIVEETLRHDPSIKHLPMRYAVTDVELPDGRTIKQGEPIIASYGAANRHPDWHGADADTFDATRVNKDHLAFGYGVHYCLGAPLARMEVVSVLEQFFARYPDAELAAGLEDLGRIPSLISNGHATLPVRLCPAG